MPFRKLQKFNIWSPQQDIKQHNKDHHVMNLMWKWEQGTINPIIQRWLLLLEWGQNQHHFHYCGWFEKSSHSLLYLSDKTNSYVFETLHHLSHYDRLPRYLIHLVSASELLSSVDAWWLILKGQFFFIECVLTSHTDDPTFLSACPSFISVKLY